MKKWIMKITTVIALVMTYFSPLYVNLKNIDPKQKSLQLNANPSTCDTECTLDFDKLENVILYIHLENGWARLKFASEILPKYFEIHGYLRNQLDLNVSDSQLFKKVVDLFNDYGNKHISSDNTFKQYTVNYLTDVRLKVKRFQITDFQATPPPKPPKEGEQPMPDKVSYFNGSYSYNTFQDKIEYLMVQRRDFDKFDYSYLYWVPIFNFLDDKVKQVKITNIGFKDESHFNYYKSDQLIHIVVKAFDNTVQIYDNSVGFTVCEDLNKCSTYLYDKQKFTAYEVTSSAIKMFFGVIEYYGNRYNFLRYDNYIKSDLNEFINYYFSGQYKLTDIQLKQINIEFDIILETLGKFFTSMFYATFDLDNNTMIKTEVKFSDDFKTKYLLQIGYFYRSLITFYPKQYLLSWYGSSQEDNILLRTYYFVADEKKHIGFNLYKNPYEIKFNVLKSYDNKLFKSNNNSNIGYINADIDVMYGTNIFTLSFPMFYKTDKKNYEFYIKDFNILNSTAFIKPELIDNEDGLLPVPNCGAWYNIGCHLQSAGIILLNKLLSWSKLVVIMKPIASVVNTSVNMINNAFPIFQILPAFKYVVNFLIFFSVLILLLRIFG